MKQVLELMYTEFDPDKAVFDWTQLNGQTLTLHTVHSPEGLVQLIGINEYGIYILAEKKL